MCIYSVMKCVLLFWYINDILFLVIFYSVYYSVQCIIKYQCNVQYNINAMANQYVAIILLFNHTIQY